MVRIQNFYTAVVLAYCKPTVTQRRLTSIPKYKIGTFEATKERKKNGNERCSLGNVSRVPYAKKKRR